MSMSSARARLARLLAVEEEIRKRTALNRFRATFREADTAPLKPTEYLPAVKVLLEAIAVLRELPMTDSERIRLLLASLPVNFRAKVHDGILRRLSAQAYSEQYSSYGWDLLNDDIPPKWFGREGEDANE